MLIATITGDSINQGQHNLVKSITGKEMYLHDEVRFILDCSSVVVIQMKDGPLGHRSVYTWDSDYAQISVDMTMNDVEAELRDELGEGKLYRMPQLSILYQVIYKLISDPKFDTEHMVQGLRALGFKVKSNIKFVRNWVTDGWTFQRETDNGSKDICVLEDLVIDLYKQITNLE